MDRHLGACLLDQLVQACDHPSIEPSTPDVQLIFVVVLQRTWQDTPSCPKPVSEAGLEYTNSQSDVGSSSGPASPEAQPGNLCGRQNDLPPKLPGGAWVQPAVHGHNGLAQRIRPWA